MYKHHSRMGYIYIIHTPIKCHTTHKLACCALTSSVSVPQQFEYLYKCRERHFKAKSVTRGAVAWVCLVAVAQCHENLLRAETRQKRFDHSALACLPSLLKFESKFITSPYPGVSACSAEKVNERERKCELQSVLTSPSAMFEVGVDFQGSRKDLMFC